MFHKQQAVKMKLTYKWKETKSLKFVLVYFKKVVIDLNVG